MKRSVDKLFLSVGKMKWKVEKLTFFVVLSTSFFFFPLHIYPYGICLLIYAHMGFFLSFS